MACGSDCKCASCFDGPLGRLPGCSPPAHQRLAARLAPRVDRLRQRLTNTGLRVYDVFLVWTKWTGRERGEGKENEVARVCLVPNPLVEDLTSLSLSPFAAGILPVGSVRISQISACMTNEALVGLGIPGQASFSGCRLIPGSTPLPPELYERGNIQPIGVTIPELRDRIPQPFSFFYEVVQNDVERPLRPKFRPFSVPMKRPGKFDWTIVLERISEDRNRDAKSQIGDDTE